MTCCNATHTTPYCPNCGKRLITDSVQEVLSNLRRQMRSAETRSKSGHGHWKDVAEKYRRQLAAIEALIEKAGGK